MSTITFDAAHLNEQQADGTACVICGTDITGPSVPIGRTDRGQVFACITHVPDAARPSATGDWPNGEPATVRDAADGQDEQGPMKVSQLLDKAATVIERNGWTQGFFYDGSQLMNSDLDREECRVCARGALNLAAGLEVIDCFDEATDRALVAIARTLGLDSYSAPDEVSDWNDAPGRTVEQVLAVLRSTAATEREAGR